MRVAKKMESASAACVSGSAWRKSICRLCSFNRFSFQMFQCGGGNAKFIRQFHSYSSTQQSENGVVVDGVSDAEHGFSRQVRTHPFRLGFAIANAVRHSTFTLMNFARKVSEFIDQTFGYETGVRCRAFKLRVPTPLIIVDLTRSNTFRQTEKVIQHMPIVRSQGCRELSFKRASIPFIADATQKDAPLLQDIFNRGIQ